MGKTTKKRNWALVVYPTKEQLEEVGSDYDGSEGYGSVPDDWRQRLQLSGLQYAISPLHDKDLLEDGSGKTKKPHYHVIVVYGSPTTYNNVKSLTDSLNSPIPQALEQVRGYYRYLTHMDNPEKYQYDEREIITGGGFNIADFIELTRAEVLQIKKTVQQLIRDLGIIEYCDLMDYLMDSEMNVEYEVACNNTFFFSKYIAGRRERQLKWQNEDFSVEKTSKITTEDPEKPTENPEKPTENSTENPEKPTEICCKNCGSVDVIKRGKTAAGSQIYGCRDCGKKFTF